MAKDKATSQDRIQVVALASLQGGSGKTTTAISLAAGLARKGKKVLFVDIDPLAIGSSIFLLPQSPQFRKEESIYVALHKGKPLPIHPTGLANLSLVPSHSGIVSDEQLTHTPESDHTEKLLKLKSELDNIKQHYDFVFIDTPSVLDWLTLNALAAADMVIVPFIPSYSAPSTFTLMREGIKTAKQLNPNLATIGYLAVNSNSSAIVEPFDKKLLPRSASSRLLTNSIPFDPAINEANFSHKDVLKFRPNSKAAHAYLKLINELFAL